MAQVQPSPYVLMLGELCGDNVSFLGERGFRVCLESDVTARPAGTFAGALLWDSLSLMPLAESRKRVELLFRSLVPGGALLAFFDTPGPAAHRARVRYRMHSRNQVTSEFIHGRSAVAHPYQNGDIVRLFEFFDVETLQMRRDGRRDVLLYKDWPDAAGARPAGSARRSS